MSQWPKWLRRQYGKLEICGSSPGYDTNLSLKILSSTYNTHKDFMFVQFSQIHNPKISTSYLVFNYWPTLKQNF